MDCKKTALILTLAVLLTGCGKMLWPFSNLLDGSDDEPVQPERVVEPTFKFSLAVGGVIAGRDELVIYDTAGNVREFPSTALSCEARDQIVTLEPRPEHETPSSGSGVRIVPISAGVTSIECTDEGNQVGGIYEVTIAPQEVIQMLVAEAAEQIANEARLMRDTEEDVVSLESESITAEALASVVRNRIELINSEQDPSLFAADYSFYYDDPPASYYSAVVMAPAQFSPAAEDDPSHGTFVNAAKREYLLNERLIAYDQAVLSAARVFNGDSIDPTGGAFAFRTPTEIEWSAIRLALTNGAEIPFNAGFTDEDFPALAPIQILIMDDVAKFEDGRPTFIFARPRFPGDPAITDVP